MCYAILAMLAVIILYDQLLFRPLVAWSARFRFETTAATTAPDPWVLALIRRTHALRIVGRAVNDAFGFVSGLRLSLPRLSLRPRVRVLAHRGCGVRRRGRGRWRCGRCGRSSPTWRPRSAGAIWVEAVLLGFFTLIRVAVLMVLAARRSGCRSACGWACGRPGRGGCSRWRSSWRHSPANLLFPPFVILIVAWHLNVDVWLTPLMVLGTQWYILFNVIAGAAAFPGDLREAAENFRVGGLLWWRRVILPGIMPYFITGAITASGGSWNAAIVAEVASWGSTKLVAHGLGAYIAAATDAGNFQRVVLGVVVMALYVLAFNRILWRPLYAYATRRATM